jgi:hypothetical protein
MPIEHPSVAHGDGLKPCIGSASGWSRHGVVRLKAMAGASKEKGPESTLDSGFQGLYYFEFWSG